MQYIDTGILGCNILSCPPLFLFFTDGSDRLFSLASSRLCEGSLYLRLTSSVMAAKLLDAMHSNLQLRHLRQPPCLYRFIPLPPAIRAFPPQLQAPILFQ